MIVFSGPNGAGKTTLARLFADRLRSEGFSVAEFKCPDYSSPTGRLIAAHQNGRHFSPDDVTALYIANVLEVEEAAGADHSDVKIFDRGRLDSYVYGRLRGSSCQLNQPSGVLQVILNAPYQELHSRLLDRGEKRPEIFRQLHGSVRAFRQFKNAFWFFQDWDGQVLLDRLARVLEPHLPKKKTTESHQQKQAGRTDRSTDQANGHKASDG